MDDALDTIEPVGPVTRRLWDATAATRARIDELEFLRTLASGTLAPEAFVRYLQQDTLYLADYRRALAMLAARADDPAASGLWAASVAEAVAEEGVLHAALLADERLAPHVETEPEASLVTRAYASSLLAAAAYEPYPVGVAAVLPCYWVYAEVGTRLAAQAAGVGAHPYATWAAAYGDPAFVDVARRAVAELERVGAGCDAALLARVERAFADATRFEELFWASAAAGESWSR